MKGFSEKKDFHYDNISNLSYSAFSRNKKVSHFLSICPFMMPKTQEQEKRKHKLSKGRNLITEMIENYCHTR